MKERFRTAHTFDMSNYFSGLTYEVGGRDFEREENEQPKIQYPATKSEKKIPTELDWSFLKKFPKTYGR